MPFYGSNRVRILIVLALVACIGFRPAGAEIKIEKDWQLPILRVPLFNPKSLSNPCVPRTYEILHKRNAEGKPYDIRVIPRASAEAELVSAIERTFRRWRFRLPGREDWRAEFLAMEQTNVLRTEPACGCDRTGHPLAAALEEFCRRGGHDWKSFAATISSSFGPVGRYRVTIGYCDIDTFTDTDHAIQGVTTNTTAPITAQALTSRADMYPRKRRCVIARSARTLAPSKNKIQTMKAELMM